MNAKRSERRPRAGDKEIMKLKMKIDMLEGKVDQGKGVATWIAEEEGDKFVREKKKMPFSLLLLLCQRC